MIADKTPTSRSEMHFTGKTWIYWAQAAIFGLPGGFSAISGPLFLMGSMRDVRGEPATGAGIALTIMAASFLGVFALAVFNILARRKPVLRLCGDGVVYNLIGEDALSSSPMVPGMIATAWAILSRKGFKQRSLLIPWEGVQSVRIGGMPMSRTLEIVGPLFELDHPELKLISDKISIPEVAFAKPIMNVAKAIQEGIERRDQAYG